MHPKPAPELNAGAPPVPGARQAPPATPPAWRRPTGLWVSLALLLVIGLPSCGGGVDSGGTGAPVASSVAVGPITGFGSVVVAGVHYDERTAAIHDDDGLPIGAAALQLGMLATVQAGAVTQVAGVPRADALSIQVSEQLRGPVSQVDVAACALTVLGQRVVAVAATAVDATVPVSPVACRLGGLRAGQLVSVHGSWDAAQARTVASRVSVRGAADAHVLRGLVDVYSAQARQITVGGQRVSLAGLAASQLPAGVATGSLVRLRLAPDASAPAEGWRALSLQDANLSVLAAPMVELEGRVTALDPPQGFSVNGVRVDARQATWRPVGAAAVLGAEVEVEGPIVAGVLQARQVTVQADDDQRAEPLELEGRITALDAAGQTFVLRGVTVSYANQPRWEGGGVASLAVGRQLSVKGVWSADGTQLTATEVHLED